MYVVRCGPKNGYQKDLWLKEIGLCAQNMTTMLGLVVYIIGGGRGLYNTINEHNSPHFDNELGTRMSYKDDEERLMWIY